MARRYTSELLSKLTVEQLENVLPNLSKKANMNLKALESKNVQNGSRSYRYIQKLAFDPNETVTKNREGMPRFVTKIGQKEGQTRDQYRKELLHRASLIARFRQSPTHTPKGVERAYDKTYRTWIQKRSEEIAGETYGMGNYTESQLNKIIKEFDTPERKSHFNQTWSDFNRDQYVYMQRHSEVVAILISEGYDSDELIQALDKMDELEREDPAKNRWKQLMNMARKPSTQDEYS